MEEGNNCSSITYGILQKIIYIIEVMSQGVLPEQSENPKQSSLRAVLTRLHSYFPHFSRLNSIKNLVLKNKLLVIIVGLVIVLLLLPLLVLRIQKQVKPKQEITRSAEKAPSGYQKMVIPGRNPSFFTLEVKNRNKYGIIPRESFVLTTLKATSEEFIKNSLSSPVPLVVNAISDTKFELTPSADMKLGQLVKIALAVNGKEDSGTTFDRDYGWAYQTQGKFRVKSTIPADKTKEVPINTGIEFVVSQDDYEEVDQFISVLPDFKYRIERHRETIAIVPLKPLNYKTVYTITLKKELGLKSRVDPLGKDTVITFQTIDEVKALSLDYLSVADTFVQLTPKEEAIIKVNATKSNMSVNTKIYKFNSGDDFIKAVTEQKAAENNWYTFFPEDQKVDLSKLNLVGQATISLQHKERLSYIQLPEKLTAGLYMLEFWYNDNKNVARTYVQSTFLSGFVSAGRVETIVWVNDVENNETVNDANVKLFGRSDSHTTGDQGTVVFDTPQEVFGNSIHFIEISRANQVLYIPVLSLSQNPSNSQTIPDDYWSYLYNERYLYKPGDTLNFWGVIKRRSDGVAPSQVLLSINPGYQNPDSKLTKTVSVVPDGSFFGSIELKDLPLGWYYLKLSVNNITISENGFEIKNYVKPQMKIEISANKKAIFTSEKVEFSGSASFYDTTPVKGLPLKLFNYSTSNLPQVTTDDNGKFKYTYQPKYYESTYNYNYYPRYESITVSPALAEQSDIEGHGSVMVYGSKLMFETTSSQQNEKASLKATINHVDLGPYNAGTSTEVKGEVARGVTVKLSVTKSWWERKETGTYYDFIEKVTRPSYTYENKTENLSDVSLKTNNEGVVNHNFTMEKEKSYKVTLVITDSDGHEVKKEEYFYYYENQYQASQENNSSPQISLNKKENSYSLGENVEVSINEKNELYKGGSKAKYLFILAQTGHQEFFVRDEPKFGFEFQQKYIPNVFVHALIFTGSYYKQVVPSCQWNYYCSYYSYRYDQYQFNGQQILYKKQDSELTLSIQADKAKYEPSDKANITVQVKKKGEAIVGATISLVVVDQALMALGGIREPNILSIYDPIGHQIYYVYSSHKPALPDEQQAEKGGGGGGDVRQTFKDTAYFGQLTTDNDGKAVFSFTLPDDLTTWLMYSQGITQDLSVGQAENSIIETKSFFVTSQFPQNYLQKDKALLVANSFGTGIPAKTQVSYEALFLDGEKEVSKSTKNGLSSNDVTIPFPELSAGVYNARLRGKALSFEDALQLPFVITDSRFSLNYSKKFQLDTNKALSGSEIGNYLTSKPVSLVLSDIGKGRYYYELHSFCYVYSNRVEKHIAKLRASQILSDTFGYTSCVEESEISKWQTGDGGYGQVQWGGSNLDTTVWSVFVNRKNLTPEEVSRFKQYFQTSLTWNNPGTVDQIKANWGLGLLGEASITTIQDFSKSSTTFEEKLTSALALATLGDIENARELYFDLLADYGYTNKPYIRLQRDQTQDANVVVNDTADALLLGSMVEKTYNEGLYSYIRDYQYDANDIVLDLSKIAFINDQITKLPKEKTSVTLTTSTLTQTVDLSKGSSRAFDISPVDLKNTNIAVKSGKAEAAFNYSVGSSQAQTLTKDKRLSIKRSYRKVKGSGSEFKTGDIIAITLSVDITSEAPRGGYSVTDFLPSGLIYLSNPTLYGLSTSGYVWQSDDLVIHSSVYRWLTYYWPTIIYYARVASPGTYFAEPAIFQSDLDKSIFATTSEVSVEIGPINK